MFMAAAFSSIALRCDSLIRTLICVFMEVITIQSERGRRIGPAPFIKLKLFGASDRCAQSSPSPRHRRGLPASCRDIYGMVAIVLYRYREHRAGASIPK